MPSGTTDDISSYPVAHDPGASSSLRGSLVVVRHGATEWSKSGRHTGRTDVPLDDDGRRKAAALAGRLAGHNFAKVLTSPLRRAKETCALAGFGARAEVRDDLAEWDYGAYEGLTTAQIRQQRPGWVLWSDGVVAGESLEEVAGRADRIVSEVRSTAGDVLAFAHGHLLRVLCTRWIGLAPTEAACFMLSPAAIGVLGWERDVAAVVLWNDTGAEVSFTPG